jgi:hypothetical protein
MIKKRGAGKVHSANQIEGRARELFPWNDAAPRKKTDNVAKRQPGQVLTPEP